MTFFIVFLVFVSDKPLARGSFFSLLLVYHNQKHISMQKEKSLYPLNFSLPCNDTPRSTVCSMGKGVEILSGGRGEDGRQNAGFGTAKLCVSQILTELSQKIRCASIESARLACIIGMLRTHCPKEGGTVAPGGAAEKR